MNHEQRTVTAIPGYLDHHSSVAEYLPERRLIFWQDDEIDIVTTRSIMVCTNDFRNKLLRLDLGMESTAGVMLTLVLVANCSVP